MNLIISDDAVKALIGSSKNKKLADQISSLLDQGAVDLSNVEVPADQVKSISGGKRLRLSLPEGFSAKTHKACTDCFRDALKEGKSENEALQASIHKLEDFGTFKIKGRKGIQTSSYCRPHQRKRSLLSTTDPNSLHARLQTLRERTKALEEREAELKKSSEQPKARLVKANTTAQV